MKERTPGSFVLSNVNHAHKSCEISSTFSSLHLAKFPKNDFPPSLNSLGFRLKSDEVLKLDLCCRRSFVFWILTTMGRSHARRKTRGSETKKSGTNFRCQIAMNFEVFFPFFSPGVFFLEGCEQKHMGCFFWNKKVKEDRLGSEERVESLWENPWVWCESC